MNDIFRCMKEYGRIEIISKIILNNDKYLMQMGLDALKASSEEVARAQKYNQTQREDG